MPDLVAMVQAAELAPELFRLPPEDHRRRMEAKLYQLKAAVKVHAR